MSPDPTDGDPSSTPSSRPPRISSRTSRLVGKSYTKAGEPRKPFVARLPESLYERLSDASDATGTSANTLVTEAVEDYLAGPRLRARLEQSRSTTPDKASKATEAERRRQDAIRKLSGR